MASTRGVKRKAAERSGCDMDGRPYLSSEMWATELRIREQKDDMDAVGSTGNEEESGSRASPWYEKSCSYWKLQEPTVRGMLGGMDNLHDRDIRASRSFLDKLVLCHGLRVGENSVALDVGAGIGRITNALLLPMFGVVDMLEQNEEYLHESKRYVKASPDTSHIGVVQNRIPCGMQGFSGDDPVTGSSYRGRYDLIWIQWCIIYLTDEDLVSFLKICFECLAPGGIICVKDNTAPKGPNSFVIDKQDSSVMRSTTYMKELFLQAGADCIGEHAQKDFPSTTFPVRTWALVEQAKVTNEVARTTRNARMTRQRVRASGMTVT